MRRLLVGSLCGAILPAAKSVLSVVVHSVCALAEEPAHALMVSDHMIQTNGSLGILLAAALG
jgi:hypothetical protein